MAYDKLCSEFVNVIQYFDFCLYHFHVIKFVRTKYFESSVSAQPETETPQLVASCGF